MKIGNIIYEQNLSVKEIRKIVKYKIDVSNLDNLSPSFQNDKYDVLIYEKKVRQKNRALDRCIASLKICLWRISDAIDHVEDEWFLKELLMQHISFVNDLINILIKYKKRMEKHSTIVTNFKSC